MGAIGVMANACWSFSAVLDECYIKCSMATIANIKMIIRRSLENQSGPLTSFRWRLRIDLRIIYFAIYWDFGRALKMPLGGVCARCIKGNNRYLGDASPHTLLHHDVVKNALLVLTIVSKIVSSR